MNYNSIIPRDESLVNTFVSTWLFKVEVMVIAIFWRESFLRSCFSGDGYSIHSDLDSISSTPDIYSISFMSLNYFVPLG